MASLLLASFVVVAAAYAVYLFLQPGLKAPKGFRQIPGPQGVPILGNVLQLGRWPQQQIRAWAQVYGPVYQMKLGYFDWVCINSPEAVKEILDKQSAVTSGRIPLPVASDLISGGMRFLFMGYTPAWRKLRAIVHKLLTPKASAVFMPSQVFEAKQLLYDLLNDNKSGEDWYLHMRRYSLSVVMTSTYGRRIPVWDCEDVREVYGLMDDFSKSTTHGAFLADMLPPLAKLPLWMQTWRKRALSYQARQTAIWMKYWMGLRTQMDLGTAPDCFVRGFIEDGFEKQNIPEVQAAYVAGTMIEAGSETTSAGLNSCMRYLAAYPDAQRKAHAELDRVIGSSRLPTFDDEEQLPYIRAMAKEVLRLRPANNIGTPHFTTADVVYKDFFIPAGTAVALQGYALNYDPTRFPDPEAFNPDRYLGHPLKAGAYTAHPDANARDHFSFGAGRRICPGMHLAENSMYIVLSRLLAAFEIRPELGPDGKEVDIDTSDDAYEDGSNTVPKPCKLRFLPRSEEARRLIVAEWKEAEANGYMLGNIRVGVDGVLSA